MTPETLHDLLRELEEVHALQIPDDDHDAEENRYTRNWSLREKIDSIPARTIDELKVKARAAQIALERDVDHSNDGLGSFANLAQSICRDIDALRQRGRREGGGLTMTTETSRLGLGALIVRTWRIKLARIVTKAAGGLMTVAERLLPPDLRRR